MDNEHPPWEDFYRDDGSLRDQDKVKAEEFVENDDRAPLTGKGSPFFSGRGVEINQFRECAGQIDRGLHANNTLVFEGAPGCGKSELLDQRVAEINTYPPATTGNKWLPVFMNGHRVMNPSNILASVDDAIAQRLAKDALREGQSSKTFNELQSFLKLTDSDLQKGSHLLKSIGKRGFRVAGFQVGAENEQTPTSIEDAITLRGPKWAGWNIVLLVDEAQQIQMPLAEGHLTTLSSIHQGQLNFPVMFAAFGLVGTRAALAKVGVSRTSLSKTFDLGCISDEAAVMAIRRANHQFNSRLSDKDIKTIAERSCGWPQHIASYLTAIAEASNQNIDAILAKGDAHRNLYYAYRLESLEDRVSEFSEYASFTATRLIGANRSLSQYDLKKDIMEKFGASSAEVEACIRAAKHEGLIRIAKDPNRSVQAPIPSFLTHLTGEPQSQERKSKGLSR